MTDHAVSGLDEEREIDLRRWVDALLSRWWIMVVGLVVGVVVGAIYAVSGTSTYTASALIARGQAFSPGGGSSVLTYLSNPLAIQTFATTEQALREAAAKAGISVGELRGHVTTSNLNRTGQAADTNSILMQITVDLKKPKKAEDAANALAEIVKRETTSGYVRQSMQIYKTRLANYALRLKTLQIRINALNHTLATSHNLSALDQLVIASQLDSAQAAYGQTLDSQTTNQQLLSLAQQVEQTQIVQLAKAQKTAARSRRNVVVVAGLIGLLVGAVIALVLGLRANRQTAAA
jgi:uncharacterized protein involved in exopolysaccharide biosynthesis